jgi:hypothetical protein
MTLNVINAAELAAKVFPTITYTVPGYITQGVTLLAGKPKAGKSWLVLNIAEAVASGGMVLGEKVEQGDVLYLALEDSQRRLKRRLDQILPHSEKPARLHLATEWSRLDKGGTEALEQWCDSVAKPRLIIIDVLAKVRPQRGPNESFYDWDYRAITPLKKLADQRGIAIVVVHHLNKLQVDDPFDAVSGTTGLTAAPDSTLILVRGPQGTALYGRGRDIEEIETALSFDPVHGVWNALGNATDVRRTDERKVILRVIAEAARLPSEGNREGNRPGEDRLLSPREIADETGMKLQNVKVLLGKMVKAGEIKKIGYGKYAHPSYTPSTTHPPVTSITTVTLKEGNQGNRGNGGTGTVVPFRTNGAAHP